MQLPKTLIVPINIHKMAHKAPKIDKSKNPLLLLACLLVTAAASPPATLGFLAVILILLKLDIRSKARFTNGLSEADAGVVGIDSTKAHKDDANRLVAPPTS